MFICWKPGICLKVYLKLKSIYFTMSVRSLNRIIFQLTQINAGFVLQIRGYILIEQKFEIVDLWTNIQNVFSLAFQRASWLFVVGIHL